MRVRIFIDFMNFSLGVKSYCGDRYRIDYRKLPEVLCREASKDLTPAIYEGTHVYASTDPTSPKDQVMLKFLNSTLTMFRGYQVVHFERKHKNPPSCKSCGNQISICPSCEMPMSGTVEKGVDAAIVTDMLSHAWNDSYDIGVLLSTDRDFIPAIEFLLQRGKKIVHAGFGQGGCELSRRCWGQIDLQDFKDEMEYKAT